MWHKRWFQWLGVLVGLHVIGAAVIVLLIGQGSSTGAYWFGALDGVLIHLWVYWGLWCRRDRRPAQWAAAAIISGDIASLLAVICLATGSLAGAIASWGIWAMGAGFGLGLAVIRLVLSPGLSVLGVARTLIDEAIRMKVALVLIVALVLLVPILPLLLDPNERLAYRLETFLIYSLTGTSVLLSLLTIFLACGTICGEISRKQIFMTMTKPIGRGRYLLGKWLGIVLLNGLLLSVAGGGVWVFARVLQQGQARDVLDRVEVDQQVLVARLVRAPVPAEAGGLASWYQKRLGKLREIEPVMYAAPLDPRLASEIRAAVRSDWYRLKQRQTAAYMFTGLSSAKGRTETVQLRIKAKSSPAPPDDLIRVRMIVNGYLVRVPPLPYNIAYVVHLPTELIDLDGNLVVQIANINPINPRATFPATVSFPLNDGLTVLYTVGSFEANMLRTLAVIWVRLGFLAMLGLAAGTFLGFPTACLISLVIWIIASTSGFLHESLEYYAAFHYDQLDAFGKVRWVVGDFFGKLADGEVWPAIKIIIKLVGSGFMLVVPSFSDYNAVPLVSDGRYVPYGMIGNALLRVGLVWTGLVAAVGYLIFRRRELARVMV